MDNKKDVHDTAPLTGDVGDFLDGKVTDCPTCGKPSGTDNETIAYQKGYQDGRCDYPPGKAPDIPTAPPDNKKDVHELKILPEYFQALITETKTFEYRRFDRDFKVGDILHLRETDLKLSQQYTGREMFVIITYILTVWANDHKRAILAIKKL